MNVPFQDARPAGTGVIAVVPLGTLPIVGGIPTPFDRLQLGAIQGHVTNLQSLWLDASASPSIITVTNRKTRQFAKWPAGSLGWQPILIGTDATQLIFEASRSTEVAIAASNYPFNSTLQAAGLLKSPFRSELKFHAAQNADVLLLPENSQRVGFTVANDSTNSLLYLAVANGVASAGFYTTILPIATGTPTNASLFSSPFPYGGEVHAFWSNAAPNGGAFVTEFV